MHHPICIRPEHFVQAPPPAVSIQLHPRCDSSASDDVEAARSALDAGVGSVLWGVDANAARQCEVLPLRGSHQSRLHCDTLRPRNRTTIQNLSFRRGALQRGRVEVLELQQLCRQMMHARVCTRRRARAFRPRISYSCACACASRHALDPEISRCVEGRACVNLCGTN